MQRDSKCRPNSIISANESSSLISVNSHVAEASGRHVLQELLATEQQYVNDLTDGIHRYTRIFEEESELPAGLLGQKDVLMANVTQIATMHRHKLLPLILEYQHDIEVLFERWDLLIENGCFNCYVLFIASQRDSRRLYNSHEMFFKRLQITLADPLGIQSFLLKPVQRLTKYPLLLSRLLEKFFENRQLISKRIFEIVCRLEKRLRRLLDRANLSDQLNDIRHFNAFSVLNASNFISVDEFQFHSARSHSSFNCKLFAFDTCLLYTEQKDSKQLLRGIFLVSDVCFLAKKISFVLCNKQRECEFVCQDRATVRKWETIMNQLVANNNRNPALDLAIEEGEDGEETVLEAAIDAVADALDEQPKSRTTWYIPFDMPFELE